MVEARFSTNKRNAPPSAHDGSLVGDAVLAAAVRRIETLEDKVRALEQCPAETPGRLDRCQEGDHQSQDLPEEVSTDEARRILRVTKDTVLKYRESGLLPYRNAAPPGSSRAVYRFPLASVLELRTSYTFAEPAAATPKESPRRRAKRQPKYKHLNCGDD
jgi:hypothetical protein